MKENIKKFKKLNQIILKKGNYPYNYWTIDKIELICKDIKLIADKTKKGGGAILVFV